MFNAITGAAARVGNYPGITVDRLEGHYRLDPYDIKLVDLPGTYSLTSYSPEEVVAREVIINERPDAVINMVDATSLERSLYLTLQLMEIGIPVVLGLNMMDELQRKRIRIDSAKLSALLKVPVVECTARIGVGRHKLMEAVVPLVKKSDGDWRPIDISYGHDLDPILDEMTRKIEETQFMTDRYPAKWVAIKYMEDDRNLIDQGRAAGPLGSQLEAMVRELRDHTEKTIRTSPEAILADYRYGFINSILRQGVITRDEELRFDISDKIDRIVTHRLLGPIIMLGVLWLMFSLTFTLGAYPQSWIEHGFIALGSLAARIIPYGLLQSLLIKGIIDGVGAVLSFTPLILIMFAMLIFLEDLGYMARTAYMLDRVFRIFGLHGASVMSFIMSGGIPGGCAVPGVMCARTLKSPRERLATLFAAPFMVCGAKTTAYLMLTAAFFPGSAAAVMLVIVLTAWVLALLTARILRWTVIRGPSTPFVMELPPYRLPTVRGIAIHTWERVRQFVTKAATVILGISIIMWMLMTFPQLPQNEIDAFNADRNAVLQESAAPSLDHNGATVDNRGLAEKRLLEIDAKQSETALKYSLAGRIGIGLEPVSKLAGFPWQVNIALLGAFAAKEVFVSSMATAYAMGTAKGGDTTTLSERLAADPSYTTPAIVSLFLFILFYAPCMVTLVTIGRESSWKWALFTLFGSISLAFGLSVVVYQMGSAIQFFWITT